MAILEYYAFEAKEIKEQASNAYRVLAKEGFNAFVYSMVGYEPEKTKVDNWKHFHDRVDLTQSTVPFGYFCIFIEISAMIVPMIRSGVIITDKVVPDISVGKTWSSYWENNDLESKYGIRIKYDHNYPHYYPQSQSNPQPSWAYPNASLGEFREWLSSNYIKNNFPKYLLNQTTRGKIAQEDAKRAMESFKLLEIEDGDSNK